MKKILAVLSAILLLLSGVAFGEETPAATQQEVKVEAPASIPQESKTEQPKKEETKAEEQKQEEPASQGEQAPAETANEETENKEENITSEPTPEVNVDTDETTAPEETPDATEEPLPTEELPTETVAPEETPVPRYTVRFLDWNDEELDKLDLAKGEAIDEPKEEPVREGWVFSYWYLASDEKQEPVDFSLKAEGDTDLKAMYTVQETLDIQDEQIPLAGPEPKIEVLFSVDGELAYGKTVYLTGNLIGFEGLEYTLQWQYNDGNGWTDVSGATDANHSFEITSANEGWQWRLSANIL